jgi:hypothetical protein
MSSVEGLVGIERNGTVRKLCLVHSIIASGHGGREKKKRKGLPGLGFSLVTCKLFTWAEICDY